MTGIMTGNAPSDPTCDGLIDRVATTEGDRHTFLEQLGRLSKSDPKRVAAALATWLHRRAGLPAADALGFPLYHLLVGRWRSARRVAFEDSHAMLSFAEIDARVQWRVSAWAGLGVGPKKVIALGQPFGADMLLDLLAVFRLGACAVWIPPLGQPFEEAALVAAKPDFVREVNELTAQVVPKAVALPPPGAGPLMPTVGAPMDYAAKAPCLMIVSPLADASEGKELPAPVVLTAAELLLALGRDATLIWGLRDGERLSAPGLDDRRHQPFLTLCTWLSGARYHYLRPAEVTQPGAFAGEYRALGVTADVRDALLGVGTAPRVRRWFRVLEDGGNPAPWAAWARRVGVDKECLSVCLDPGLGGVAVAVVAAPDSAAIANPNLTDSAAAKQMVVSHHPAYPAFGLEWKAKPLPGGAPDDGIGLLAFKDKRAAAPYLLVRDDAEGLSWLDVLDLRRRGQVFPRSIVAAAVAGLPGILGASVVAVRKASTARASFGLVVFVAGSVGTWNEVRRQAVATILTRHATRVLHAELRPDFIEVHPVLPHLAKTTVDADWVLGERWSGGLERRSQLELFRQLAAMGLAS